MDLYSIGMLSALPAKESAAKKVSAMEINNREDDSGRARSCREIVKAQEGEDNERGIEMTCLRRRKNCDSARSARGDVTEGGEKR